MFKLAEAQRRFRNEGIKGQVVLDVPLLLAGRLWEIWPGIKEEEMQSSEENLTDCGPKIGIELEPRAKEIYPCFLGVSQPFSLQHSTNGQ